MRKGSSFFVAVAVPLLVVTVAVLLWFFSNPGHLTRAEATSDLVSFATQTLELSAVTGFAAMSTLEMLKRLLHLRGQFFLREIPRLAGPALVFGLVSPTREDYVQEDPGEKDVSEAPWGYARRLDLPLEQLVAQLGYAVDAALARVATGRRPRDDDLLFGLLGFPRDNGAPWKNYHFASNEEDLTMLRADTQAALDDLQVRLGNAWRWRLRLASSILAAVFALVALIYVPVPPGTKLAALVGSFLIGGFFAGFFRDLVAVVERLRRI